MVRRGWVRNHVNRQVSRIRQIFKWAVSEELINASILHALQAVTALRPGRGDGAKESEPVRPIANEIVDATLKHLPAMAGDMVRVQRLTGMRAGELCRMRGIDLDTTGKVWTYKPAAHKTAHHGHIRTIYIGPRGQMILQKYLRPTVDEFLFQPAESELKRRQMQHAERVTPDNQGNRPGTNKVRRRQRPPGERYDVAAYRRAIARACSLSPARAHA